MRIATFNANSLRSRMEAVLAWCDLRQPDILCIQETKVQDDDFPAAPLEAAGWHVVFRGQKAYNGVAVIARNAPDEWSAGFEDGGPDDASRLLVARFGALHVVNTYVPQGREITHAMYAYKLAWFGRLRALFEARFTPEDLVLWAGDLNVARQPEDVHSPGDYADHVCFHADARRAFEDALAWGFVDVFRKHHPEPRQFTFFDYRTPNAAKRGLGWRIDYLLASPALAERSTDAFIDLEPRLAAKPSDHTFLGADFTLD